MQNRIMFFLALIALSIGSITAQTISVKNTGEPFSHYWSVGVGAGRANEGLRAGWLEHLNLVKEECGFRYVRMHGIFHDDMFVYFQKPNGEVVYNWQYIDELYDRMLDMGVKPFVELAFFPKDMALKDSKTQFWWKANVSVDSNNFGKWHDLVKAFTQHVVERYGLEEVRTWYFEVWNEPNLTGNGGFFHGTRSDYFRLYKEAALAVKSVNKQLRIGGPATSNYVADKRHEGEVMDHKSSVFYSQEVINTKQWKGVWIEDFLKYCEKEGLPVDFVSTHPYPTDYALDPETNRSKDAIRYVHSLRDDLTWLKQQITNSKYPNAEIHLTEWSTSPNSRDKLHDVLPPAAYIIKANLDCLGMANSLMYWTFTDVFEEKGGGETIFHGGFGMINFQGLVKPSFHAYRMLHQLGDEKLYYSDPLFVSRSSKNGKISAIAFNYPKEYEERVPSSRNFNNYMKATSKQVNIILRDLKPGTNFSIETLDKEHGNVYDDYAAIGSPHSPTREETSYLKQKAWETHKETLQVAKDGTLTLNRRLEPWSCVLIKEL